MTILGNKLYRALYQNPKPPQAQQLRRSSQWRNEAIQLGILTPKQ